MILSSCWRLSFKSFKSVGYSICCSATVASRSNVPEFVEAGASCLSSLWLLSSFGYCLAICRRCLLLLYFIITCRSFIAAIAIFFRMLSQKVTRYFFGLLIWLFFRCLICFLKRCLIR